MNLLLGFANGVLGFFSIGPMELALMAALGVLIFGHRLPKVARSLGRGITEFKRGLRDVRDRVDVEADIRDSETAGEAEPSERDADRPRRTSRRARRSDRGAPRRRRRLPDEKDE
jgi:sec-independent protein translocase protein TatA